MTGINIEAEKDILSIILNNPNMLVEDFEKWREELFFDPFHHKLVLIMKNNMVEGIPIEISTLSNNRNEQDEIRLIKLRDKAPEFFNDFYRILEECFIHRSLSKIQEEIANRLLEETISAPSEILHKLTHDLEKLEELRSTSIYTASEVIDNVIERYEEIFNLVKEGKEYKPIGVIETPFIGLNKIFKKGGFTGGDLVILAASPSTGKSEFALNLAAYASMSKDKNAFVYSLEMKKESLIERILLLASQVDSKKLENGFLTESEHTQLTLAAKKIKNSKLFFEDNLSADIYDIIASIRKVYQKHSLDFVVIDYLQLIKFSLKAGTRNDELSTITRLLKQEAMRLDIPFLVLSQLSRRHIIEGREPHLQDLRDSGAIEQDADSVIFLHATAAEMKKEVLAKTKATVGKQREGSVGEIYLKNRKTVQTFVEIKESDFKKSTKKSTIKDDDLPF